ncbi:copper resistance system multicopper oxidase [Kangiella sp. TOML190]|uniref:copper resistance system multicopper oxidase n=1 Tax=Kangiella sp. TOML190 TaxID=2931351 RepID=UPI00203ADF50|nr:copper resistance system multicopper oxidase [Kangiella sp. TOML190]
MNNKCFRPKISRRQFVLGASSSLALSALPWSRLAASPYNHEKINQLTSLKGNQFDLNIGYHPVNFTGKPRLATCINQGLPAPLLHWQEGQRIKINVSNHLKTDSSIHWHGMILPSAMDGVPGLSFDGIKPGETFQYEFDINQSGTYWYHSHSGFQEQTGVYGPIIIHPKEPEPFEYDCDFVVMLSDWSDEDPHDIYAKLKKMSHYYNFRERTMRDLWRDIREKGLSGTLAEREMWNQMRMSETDIADVTGYTYSFLMNGNTPDLGWLGQFRNGDKVRLRFINAAAMTIFDVRIPGLKMRLVATDGQLIQPVSIDEFRIGVAETYDVIVEPEDKAYTIFAQSIDRSGFARGTLTPDLGYQVELPGMDFAPILEHRDMGMDHSTSSHIDMDHSKTDHSKMDHQQHQMPKHNGMQHHKHHDLMAEESNLGKAGFGSHSPIQHAATEFGPQVDMRAEMPMDGVSDPGVGLRQHQARYGRRVLQYSDLKNYYPTQDKRQPSRELHIHLTGNMSRYMWSMNGVKHMHAEPIHLEYGERIRIVLINDTMMTHPVHLHGVWSELETGDPDYIPKKHTIIVQPGSKVSYLVTADAKGRWAYHCHLLFHMPGMMREVRIG